MNDSELSRLWRGNELISEPPTLALAEFYCYFFCFTDGRVDWRNTAPVSLNGMDGKGRDFSFGGPRERKGQGYGNFREKKGKGLGLGWIRGAKA